MWARVVYLALLLVVAPVFVGPVVPCCDASDACCGDEAPSCPVAPDGECVIAATGPVLGTVIVAPELPSPSFAPCAPASDTPRSVAAARSLRVTVTTADRPLFLRLHSLRN